MKTPYVNFFKVVLLCLPLFACHLKQSQKSSPSIITVQSLLKEMVNRDNLAKRPEHAFKTLQASSYSRKSITKVQEGWFDNHDASQFIRVDTIQGRKEYVLMEAEGPGAIVRFWSTWHAQQFSMGTLRFYFDHAATPQIAGSINQVISSNKYIGAPLSQATSPFLENGGWFSGHNLYFPLPYAKHCKVTYQKANERVNDVLYYQINYRQYTPETSVETYAKGDWENGKYKEAISQASKKLSVYDTAINNTQLTRAEGTVKIGKSVSTTIDGEKVIKKITLKITAKNLEQALRSTVISMTFDGKKTVWAPIGDLFGIGYKISPYKSWLSEVKQDGEMALYFPMPFQKSAEISIHNHGKQNVELQKMQVQYTTWEWDERSLYFHANWRSYPNMETSKKRDVNFITIKGQGKYIGDVLALYNNSYEWWGEGDEKIYVDSEPFPSHFGTGTEDYYGYAWCSVVNFEAPFIAQPIANGNRSPGLTVNSRWRSLDAIPFNSSLRFDMEIWHWASTRIDYAPTTFWYGAKDAKAEFKEDIESVQIPVKFPDKFEAEGFTVKQVSGGQTITEAFLSYNWSARNHLLWKGVKAKDTLKTVFYSEKERNGKLTAAFTHAPDYVVVDVLLNNQLVFENLDLYNDKLSLKACFFKEAKIKKGNNTLTLVVKGTNKINPKADKMGLDYIMVQ